MTEHLAAETMIALGACTQPPPVAQRPVLSLVWTLDPSTERPVCRWVADVMAVFPPRG
jgi:hypothetical protein